MAPSFIEEGDFGQKILDTHSENIILSFTSRFSALKYIELLIVRELCANDLMLR